MVSKVFLPIFLCKVNNGLLQLRVCSAYVYSFANLNSKCVAFPLVATCIITNVLFPCFLLISELTDDIHRITL